MHYGVSLLAAITVLLLPSVELSAQETEPSAVVQTEAQGAIEEIIVTAERRPSVLLETPASISVVSAEEILTARPALGLDEALDVVPGVFAQSARNFSQDTRVSIRGFGSRAEFGVRGIKVLVDGVPNTLPDGQTELDSLELDFVDRIEVVRGPVSSLYGGGGGGLISVSTIEPSPEPRVTLRTLFGTDHLSKYSATVTGTHGATGYAAGLVRTRQSAYRDHNRAEQTVLMTKLRREIEGGAQLGLNFSAVWAPEAQDAGGLRATEVSADRKQARSANVIRDAGEKLNQQKLSVSLRQPLGQDHEVKAVAYVVWRDFSNSLPIDRRVDFDRTITGGSLQYLGASGIVSWIAGLDVDIQKDRRRNYRNEFGARGDLTLSQSETVRAVGPFAQVEVALPHDFSVVAGARYDWVEFVVGDRFVTPTNGDRSDRMRFRELSPRLGIHWGRSPALQLYANLATGFRVPTTTELSPSDANGGFSSDLDPERSVGLEVGAKGLLWERIYYDLALFDMRIDDVAVEFEDATGQSLFRDAGEARRRGVEFAFSASLTPGLSMRAGYTYADYRYKDFKVIGTTTEFDGNREPNTPKHSVTAELRGELPSGVYGTLALRHFSDIEVNDANCAESSGATLSDARVGWQLERGDTIFESFLGARNWSGARFNGSLRPNSFSIFNPDTCRVIVPGRYYEPAPETELYMGVQVRF